MNNTQLLMAIAGCVVRVWCCALFLGVVLLVWPLGDRHAVAQGISTDTHTHTSSSGCVWKGFHWAVCRMRPTATQSQTEPISMKRSVQQDRDALWSECRWVLLNHQLLHRCSRARVCVCDGFSVQGWSSVSPVMGNSDWRKFSQTE